MKKLLLLSLISGGLMTTALAQNYDDVYYRPQNAKKQAEMDAEQEKQNASTYSSSQNQASYNDNYSESYYDEDGYNDSYIDYDDDSYTTRIRRFQYPMSNVGYYGSIYNPYWGGGMYSNMGWGMTPGISINIGYNSFWGNPYGFYSGFGYNPYYGMGYSPWGMGFGMGYGMGYGGYRPGIWGNPYYGGGYYGGGYGYGYNRPGFENGYNNAPRYNYGPRGVNNSGQYSNTRTVRRSDNGMITPDRASVNNTRNNTNVRNQASGNVRSQAADRNSGMMSPPPSSVRRAQGPTMNSSSTRMPSAQSGSVNRSQMQQSQNSRGNTYNATPSRQMQNSAPARSNYNMSPSTPARSNYNTSPSPSRSMSAPSGGGSMRSSAPSGGGSMRSSGGGVRR